MKRYLRHLFPVLFILLSIELQAQYALTFDGVDDFVEIADHNSLDLSANFTIETWVKPMGIGSSPAEGGIIINKESSYEFARFPDGTLRFALSASGTGSDWAWINTFIQIPLNEWTHVAMIKAGTNISFVINGVVSYTNNSFPETMSPNGWSFRIGGRSISNHYFNGQVDDVRVWNIARSTSDIKKYMVKPVALNASGLVAYYTMSEGSGNVIVNSVPGSTGMNGTLYGSTWIASPVQFSANALSFDGINDHVSISNHATLNISNHITIEAWINPASRSGSAIQNVISKSSNTQNNSYIFPRTDNSWNHIRSYLHINGSWQILQAPFPAALTWYHTAVTYDGAFVRMYINGSEVVAQPQTGALSTNSNALTLGNQPGYTEYYQGSADEVRIWNVARSQTEIQQSMNAELDAAAQTGLVAYYKFDHGEANGNNTALVALPDQAGSNNGTLNSFALSGSSSNYIPQHNTITILPVRLSNFIAQKNAKTVSLSWTTSQEMNAYSFEVQHSLDGVDWKPLGEVAANGNAQGLRTYFYTHRDPPPGINYYRLKQVDKDGRFEMSKIVSVKFLVKSAFAVYPNPVIGKQVQILVNEATTLFLYNQSGRLLWSRKVNPGVTVIEAPVSKGFYWLKTPEQSEPIIIR